MTTVDVRVIELLCEGKTNKAIADALGCTVTTVKHRLSNLYVEFDCKNRAGLAAFAVRKELIYVEAR
jgi:DNA-binding NarL/FixJ family response regulator